MTGRMIGSRHTLTHAMVDCMATEHLAAWLNGMSALQKAAEKKGHKGLAQHYGEVMQYANSRLAGGEDASSEDRPKRRAPVLAGKREEPEPKKAPAKISFGNISADSANEDEDEDEKEQQAIQEADFRKHTLKTANEIVSKMRKEVKTLDNMPYRKIRRDEDTGRDVLYYGTISGFVHDGEKLEIKAFPDGITPDEDRKAYNAAHYMGPKKNGDRREISAGRTVPGKDAYYIHACKLEDGLALTCFISDKDRQVLDEAIVVFNKKEDAWVQAYYHGDNLSKGQKLLKKRPYWRGHV